MARLAAYKNSPTRAKESATGDSAPRDAGPEAGGYEDRPEVEPMRAVSDERASTLGPKDAQPVTPNFSEVFTKRLLSGALSGIVLTPVGASVAYYAPQSVWNRYLELSRVPIAEESFDGETLVSLLFRKSRIFDSELKNSLSTKEDKRVRTLARHAFRCDIQRTTHLEFMHGLMQLLVADRMAWALSERGEEDDRRPPVPYMNPEGIVQQKKVIGLHLRWDQTLAEFLSIWGIYKSVGAEQPPAQQKKHRYPKKRAAANAIAATSVTKESSGSLVSPQRAAPDFTLGGSLSKRSAVLVSLVGGIVDTENRAKLAKVENNFCLAALGLYALAQREAMRPSSGESCETPRLVEVLQQTYPNLPDSLRGLDDINFLRPLYIAAAISPTCLLTPMQLGTNSSLRIGLPDILKVATSIVLQPHVQRRDVEHGLMNVICEMATSGRSAFESTMPRVLRDWECRNIIQAGRPVVDPKALEVADVHAVWKKVEMERPLTLQVVQYLSHTIEPPDYNKKKWTVIDLTGDEPDESLGQAILEHQRAESVKREQGEPVAKRSTTPGEASDSDGRVNKRVRLYLKTQLISDESNRATPAANAEEGFETGLESDEVRVHSLRERPGQSCKVNNEVVEGTEGTEERVYSLRQRRGSPHKADDKKGVGDRRILQTPLAGHKAQIGGSGILVALGPDSEGEDEVGKQHEESKGQLQSGRETRLIAPVKKRKRREKPSQEYVVASDAEEAQGDTVAKRPRLSNVADSPLRPESVESRVALGRPSAIHSPKVGSSRQGHKAPACGLPLSVQLQDDEHSSEELDDLALRHAPYNAVHELNREYTRSFKAPDASLIKLPFMRPTVKPLIPLPNTCDNLDPVPSPIGHGQAEHDSQERGDVQETQDPPLSPLTELTSDESVDSEDCGAPKSVQIDLPLDDAPPSDYAPHDFHPVEKEVQMWSTMQEELEEIKELMGRTVYPSLESPAKVQTFSRSTWDGMTFEQRRACFKRGVVHVVGRPWLTPHGIRDRHDPRLANLINVHASRQCRDHTLLRKPNSAETTVSRRLTLREFLDDLDVRERDGTRSRCCNTLDIPLIHNCIPLELDDFSKFALDDFECWSPYTRLGLKSLSTQWALAAHASAYSRLHIDAAGLCTHVYMVGGEKAWWVAKESTLDAGEDGFSLANGLFECVYLSAGDELYMPPGTPHAVLTLEDSIALGGHFYSFGTTERTLHALLQEHLCGTIITNTEHTRAPLLLMKGFMQYAVHRYNPDGATASPNDPSPDEFAALLVLLQHLQYLWPELPPDSPESCWQGTENFRADHQAVSAAVVRFMEDVSAGSKLNGALASVEARFEQFKQRHFELRRDLKPFPRMNLWKGPAHSLGTKSTVT